MTSRIGRFFAGHRKLAFVVIAVLLASAVFAGYRLMRHLPRYKGGAALDVNLYQPDFLLRSKTLSRLPKDIADTPILSGLVDEQLVFHYEEDEARLSVEGSLRRLAYEHNLELGDHFLSALLAAPAEVGVWRNSKGRPEHFVAVIERSALAGYSGALARIVSSDKHLGIAGRIPVSGDEVPMYTLNYGGHRTLAFAGKGERLLVLSDPRLAFGKDDKLTDDAANILPNLLQGHFPWRDRLPVDRNARHSVVLGRAALTLNYGRFLPALAALRFDHDGRAWSAAIRFDPEKHSGKLDFSRIWRAVPDNAALCVALPVDWQMAGKPLQELLGEHPALRQTLMAIDPVAAACWYADSRLATPLLVARANGKLPPETTGLLAGLVQKAWGEKGGIQNERKGDVERYGRSADPVLLARQDNLLFFSPDGNLVNAALAVGARQAPALSDQPGAAAGAWLIYDPTKLGRLLRTEIENVLPQDEETFFRDVARTRLWPRFNDWGKRHAASVLVPGTGLAEGFVRLETRPLKKK